MTKVEFILNEQDKYIGFRVEGHTGLAAQGEDILCAAVSMVSQATLLGIITTVVADAEVQMNKQTALMAVLVIDNDQRKLEDVDLLIKVMHSALGSIEPQYNQYISIEVTDVRASKSSAQLWSRIKKMREVKV